ncbi:iron-sulfur cluster assembly scaffold protein [Candidatus Woesearchaeota archaeon]|nr:iron-sulfur cluster assembly scaffold protein [Candidatus Woesearchaeota archaeon]
MKTKNKNKAWFYSEEVKEHFFKPKNFIKTDAEIKKFKADGVGMVGSPACGDMMKMWIKVDKEKEVITDIRWQTFGCASAIATTSVLSELAKGMKLEEARKITPKEIVDKLEGIPAVKFHCSVLGDKALREAINDYFRKTEQYDRVITDSPVVDEKLKITERDIENAVIEGAKTLKEVQQKTKVGIESKKVEDKVKELLEKYKKKHFGGKNGSKKD